MVQSKRPLKRLLALLLALVMVLALYPATVFAAPPIDESSGSSGSNYEGSGSHDDWMPVGYGKTFVRFTIIRFPYGIDQWDRTNKDTGEHDGLEIYGQSLDMSSTYTTTDAAKVQLWWNTNAMSAKQYMLYHGSANWNQYYANKPGMSSYSSRFFNFDSVVGKRMPDLFGDKAEGSNAFVKMFTTTDNEGNIDTSTEFDRLLAKLGERLPEEKRLTAYDFVHGIDKTGQSSHVDYRLIIEPGVFTEIDGDIAAMTWRDMAAYTLNNPTSGNKSPAYTWHTNSQNICYGLYLTRDEFVEGTGEDAKPIGNKAFSAITETPEFGKNASMHFKDFRDVSMSSGYALSIINPGDAGAQYSSYVGRVNLFIPTDKALTNGSETIGATVYSYTGDPNDIHKAITAKPSTLAGARAVAFASGVDLLAGNLTKVMSVGLMGLAGVTNPYAYIETGEQTSIWASGLGDSEFNAAVGALGLNGVANKQVVTEAPQLKEGLTWGYIGEAVTNFNIYKEIGGGKMPVTIGQDAVFEFVAQGLQNSLAPAVAFGSVHANSKTWDKAYATSIEQQLSLSAGMGGIVNQSLLDKYMAELDRQLGETDTWQQMVVNLAGGTGVGTGINAKSNTQSLHTELDVVQFKKLCMMAPQTVYDAMVSASTSGYQNLTSQSKFAQGLMKMYDTSDYSRALHSFIAEVSLGIMIVNGSSINDRASRCATAVASGKNGTRGLSVNGYLDWLAEYQLSDYYRIKGNTINDTSTSKVGYGAIDPASGDVSVGFLMDLSSLYSMVRSTTLTAPFSQNKTYTANYAREINGKARGVTDIDGGFTLASYGGYQSRLEFALVAGDRNVRAAANLDNNSKHEDTSGTKVSGDTSGEFAAGLLSLDAAALASLSTLNTVGNGKGGQQIDIDIVENGKAKAYEVNGTIQLSTAVYAPCIKGDTVLISEVTKEDGTKGYKVEGVIYNDFDIPVGTVSQDKVYLTNYPNESEDEQLGWLRFGFGGDYYKPLMGIMAGYTGKSGTQVDTKASNDDVANFLIEHKEEIKAGTCEPFTTENLSVESGSVVAYPYLPGEKLLVGVDMSEAFKALERGTSINSGKRGGLNGLDPKQADALEAYMDGSASRFKQFVLVEPKADLRIVTVQDGKEPGDPAIVSPPNAAEPDPDGNVTPPEFPGYEMEEWVVTPEPPKDIKEWPEVPEGKPGVDPKIPVDEDSETIYVHYTPKVEGGQFVGANRLTESRIANGTSLSTTVQGGLQPNKVTTTPEWWRWCPGHGTKENPLPCPQADKGGCILVHIGWSDHDMLRHNNRSCYHTHERDCASNDLMNPGECDCEYQYKDKCTSGNEIELFDDYYSSCGNWDEFTKEDANVAFYIGWANSSDSKFTAEGATVAAGEWAGGFKPLYSYDGGGVADSKTKLIEHAAPWDYGDEEYMDKHLVEMYYDMFRGSDKVTIATLQNSDEVNQEMTDKGLLLPIGKNRPTGTRAERSYSDTVKFVIDDIETEESDYASYATTSGAKKDYSTDGKVHISGVDYEATIDVDVFRDPAAGVGNAKASDNAAAATGNAIKIGGNVYGNVLGTAVNNSDVGPDAGTTITFHPYVRMFYGKPNEDEQENPVNVLADQMSTISPVDYVEVGYRHKTNGTNLNLTSTQWSTHKTAVGKWGANNVLPGGALYQLNVVAGTETEVGASVWFTFIKDADAPKFVGGASTYSYNAQMEDVREYLTNLRASIESYDVVEMLEDNASTSANPLANGKEILMQGGQSLFDGLKSSNDGKYWLNRGTYGNAAANVKSNRADLDVIADTSMQTFFCVWSDVEGNVYVGKSNTIDGAKTSVIAQISKGESAASLINKNQDTKDLDARTKLITNFISALDRNKGNDVSLDDPRWYNEANDGIYVCKYDAVMTLGFNTTNPVRTAAIDPKQEAPRASQSALFGDANAAAFKISAAPTVKPDVQGYMGQFKGQTVKITKPDMMLSSKVFWIPNVSVTDLY